MTSKPPWVQFVSFEDGGFHSAWLPQPEANCFLIKKGPPGYSFNPIPPDQRLPIYAVLVPFKHGVVFLFCFYGVNLCALTYTSCPDMDPWNPYNLSQRFFAMPLPAQSSFLWLMAQTKGGISIWVQNQRFTTEGPRGLTFAHVTHTTQ